MSNKGTLKSIDNIKAVLTGRVSTYGNDSKDIYANTFYIFSSPFFNYNNLQADR